MHQVPGILSSLYGGARGAWVAPLAVLTCVMAHPACNSGSAVSSRQQPGTGIDSGASSLPKPKATLFKEVTHGSMRSASRIAISPSGQVVVTDPRGQAVHLFSNSGTWTKKISGVGQPLGCAVDKAGRIYVGDRSSASVMVYSSTGGFLHTLNKPPVKLLMPNELEADRVHDEIFVSDSKANQVVVFNTKGALLRKIGGAGKGQLDFPTGLLYQSANDRLLVGDHNHSRVQIFDRKGTWIASFGSFGDKPGTFTRIQGLALDSTQRLYVVDVYQGRLQVVDTKGAWINTVGTGGMSKGTLALPTDAVMDSNNRLWVTSFRTAKVVVYTIGKYPVPDQGKPDQAKPDQAMPDQAKPDQAKPDQAVVKPDKAATIPDTAAATPDQALSGPDQGGNRPRNRGATVRSATAPVPWRCCSSCPVCCGPGSGAAGESP